MARYLNLTPLPDVLALIRREFPAPSRTEYVPLAQATGRITKEPLFAAYTVPAVPVAAMDGFAVCSSETHSAREKNPLSLSATARVNTGNPLPPGTNAVVMIEDVDLEGSVCVIRKPAGLNQHVRLPGEEIREGDMVLPPGHIIRPFDIGALASYGVSEVAVQTLRVGLVPTGSELVSPGTRPGPGQVVESNTLMADAYLKVHGVEGTRYQIVPDEPHLIRAALEKACQENDLVIISAGSSAGTRDYTADILSSLGMVHVHGIAMRPGKPAIVGKIGTCPVIGLPGFPVAAQTVLREIVSPLLAHWGFSGPEYRQVMAVLSQSLASDPSMDEFVAVTVGKIGETLVGLPQGRGAAVQMAGLRGNAILHIAASSEGIPEGALVPLSLMVPEAMIGRTLIFSGITDPAVDLLMMLLRQEGLYPVLTRSGNVGAVRAIGKSFCHAGVVNFRGAEGENDTPSFTRMIRGESLTGVCLAEIPLGLVSARGVDLVRRAENRFVFREPGSLPRVMLDKLLALHSVSLADLPGPLLVVRSHDAVASAVAEGLADAGISTQAAAVKHNLVFMPLSTERLEMLFKADSFTDVRVAKILDIIESSAFRDLLRTHTNYNISETGSVRPIKGTVQDNAVDTEYSFIIPE